MIKILLGLLLLLPQAAHAQRRAVMEGLAASNTAIFISTPTGNVYVRTAGTMTVAGNAFSVGASTLVVAGGNVGVGVTIPLSKSHSLLSGTGIILSGSDQSTGAGAGLFEGPSNNLNTASNPYTLNIVSNDAVATDAGGQIGLGGKYSGNSFVMFAGIKSGKENATAGQTGGYMAFGTRANGGNVLERVRIDPAGKVGIGTLAPASALHIDTGFITIARPDVTVRVATIGVDSTGFYMSAPPVGAYPIYWLTGGSEKMRLDSTGRLGIGTASPANGVLRLNTPASASNYMQSFSVGDVQKGFIYWDNANSMLQLGSGAAGIGTQIVYGAGSVGVSIDSTGKVGIGNTTPATALDVTGTVTASAFVTGASGSAYSGALTVYTIGTPSVGVCIPGSTVTFTPATTEVDVVNFGNVTQQAGAADCMLNILVDGAYPSPFSATVGLPIGQNGYVQNASFTFPRLTVTVASHNFCLVAMCNTGVDLKVNSSPTNALYSATGKFGVKNP